MIVARKTHFVPEVLSSAMCIRQIKQCNQLHRYILCIVGVIVCKEYWAQDRADYNSKLFSL